MNPARPKTTGQVRAIFAAAQKAGVDFNDKELRGDTVEAVTRRTRHLSELTFAEAQRVLQKLKGQSFVPLRTLQHRRKQAGIQQIITDDQQTLIAELASQRKWSVESLTKFCQKVIKRDRPLTTAEAGKVIEGLKAMNRRDNLWAA